MQEKEDRMRIFSFVKIVGTRTSPPGKFIFNRSVSKRTPVTASHAPKGDGVSHLEKKKPLFVTNIVAACQIEKSDESLR